jgi:hypothetical protein
MLGAKHRVDKTFPVKLIQITALSVIVIVKTGKIVKNLF